MEENIPTTNNSEARNRMSTEAPILLQNAEMPRAPTVSSPPEHAADDSRSPSKYQKCRAATLCCLLTQYNILIKRRDRNISDGTYDPNTEQNRIDADKIRNAIEAIRKLYQHFVAASKRNNTEHDDSKLMEMIVACGITSDEDVIYDGRRERSDSPTSERERIERNMASGITSDDSSAFEGLHTERSLLLGHGLSSRQKGSEINLAIRQMEHIFLVVAEQIKRQSTSPVNHTERSETNRVTQVDQIQDTVMQGGSNSLSSNGSITDHETPLPQAGPSRIGQENLEAPAQGSSSLDEGNGPKNYCSIQNGESTVQQAGPSHNQDKRPASLVDFLKKYESLSDFDMVPIGHGNAMVPIKVIRHIEWHVHTIATRQLLHAIFPRSVLASHSLTGKRSPAFLNRPAKNKLDPKLVEDVIIMMLTICEVTRHDVRTSITITCTDEAKMYRNRQIQREKCKKRNNENKPPLPSSDS